MPQPSLRESRRPPTGRGFLAALAALVLLPAPALSVDFDITAGPGPVYAVQRVGDKVFLGGWFDYVGPRTGKLAAVHSVTGDLLKGFPRADGYVVSVASDGQGGWFIGGEFTHVGKLLRPGLAHVRPDQTVSEWRPEADGEVYTLVMSGRTVYIGGDFDTVNGHPRVNLCAIDAVTGEVLPGTPNTNAPVLSLAVDDTSLYIAGRFDTIGGQARVGLAAMELTSGVVTTWNPDADGTMTLIHLSGHDLFVVGNFARVGGQSRSIMAAVDVRTATATSFDPRPSGGSSGLRFNALAADDSSVYVGGGLFRSIGGQQRQHFAALDRTSGQATSWDPAPNSFVYALSVSDHTLFLSGRFRSIAGARRARTAAFDLRAYALLDWNPGTGGDVITMGVADSTVCLGGTFDTAGGEERVGLAALDARTGRLSSWGRAGTDGSVRGLLATDSTLYVCGNFRTLGGLQRNGLGAIDLRTGLVTAWDPGVGDPSGLPVVTCVSEGASTVYVGGAFSSVGGESRANIAEIDKLSGEPTDWIPGADGPVRALSLHGTTLYAGGDFRNIGGSPRNFVAALHASTGAATPWDPNADSRVHAMALDESVAYLGGQFWSIGGQLSRHLAAVDLDSGTLVSDFPLGVSDPPIYALTLVNHELYVGGTFWWIWYQARNGLASIRTELGQLTDWSPSVAGAYSIDVAGQQLYVGMGNGVATFPLERGSPPSPTHEVHSSPLPSLQVSPNPAVGSTRVDFVLGSPGAVRLRILDVAGRTVATLVDGDRPAGPMSATWENTDRETSSGVYFAALEHGGRTVTRRIVYVR